MSKATREAQKKVLELYKFEEEKHLHEKVALLRALEARFGPDVVTVVRETKGQQVRKVWSQIPERLGGNTIEHLIAALWEANAQLFDFSLEKRENGETQLCVTRCFFQELAHALDATDWGYHLFCADDPHIVAGFNPRMGFRRTKTLMEGADCCDHCYFMREDDDVQA